MNKTTPLPNTNALQEQASQWLARIDRGLSIDEQAELRRWTQSASHREILLSMARLWDSMSTLSELSELFPLDEQIKPSKKLGQYYSLAAGAIVCILAVGLASLQLYFNNTGTPINQTYSTAVGEQQQVILSDGSVMHLNTDSQIQVKYSAERRDIYLNRGEAHFKVAHNKQRPFIVHANSHTITAVGTAFNVQLAADTQALEILVTEGKVAFGGEPLMLTQSAATPDTPARPAQQLLQAGEKLALTSNKASNSPSIRSAVIDSAAMDSELAWQRGFMVFSGESLQTVMDEVGRYSELEFSVADDIQQLEIAGYFRTDDVDSLLLSLQENFNIHSERTDQAIQLARRK